jgi:carboxypeptidase PM20D1
MKAGSRFLVLLILSAAAGAQDHSSAYTEPYQKKALEVYRESIGYRTAKGHGEVPAFADYLAQQFRDAGFAEEDINLLPQMSAANEEVASLVVTYRGDDSSGRKPILLVAHMDVVDALPEDWDRDPFTLIEEDGFFFGRGTIDDKLGTTMLTATFLRLKAEGFMPTRNLVIVFTGDEESGMSTTKTLVREHRGLIDAEFALNADAGRGVLNRDHQAIAYELQAAEKTYVTFELTITNPGGHSSRPRKDNAIYELARVLGNIEDTRFPVRANEVTRKYFELMAHAEHGEVAEAMRRFANYPLDESASVILSRDPLFNAMIRTTCTATMLDAGHAENALPQSATATVNCRLFPGVEVAEVQGRLFQVAENKNVNIRILREPTSSPASPLREDVVSAVTKAVHARFADIPVIPMMEPGGTDGLHLRNAGIPTYGIMGYFIRTEDESLHGLNERVPVRSFFAALEHWYIVLHELAGR